MTGGLHILSAGIASPVGFTLAANVAAFRSGLNSFVRPRYFRGNQSGEYITVSTLDSLKETSAAARMLYLAQVATQEACRPLAQHSHLRLALLFAANEDRPGLSLAAAQTASRVIAQQALFRVQKDCCYLQPAGSAGALPLLQLAQQLIHQDAVDLCLLGGADSYLEIDSLHWLETCGRLKSSQQPNGVIPGEAAAFLVLASGELAARFQLPSLAEISGIASAAEPRPWFQRQATLGQGLTQALRQTFRSAPPPEVDLVLAEINGESWRADEWSYAYLRNATYIRSPLRTVHPANSFGEIGAAFTPLSLALGAATLNQTSQNNNAILVWSASGTTALRGSCLLRKVQNPWSPQPQPTA